jgi:TnpA family transposase
MPLISDTAYPRLDPSPSPTEVARFTPTPAEMAFVHRHARHPGPRLALLVLLKTFQRLGYFVPFEQVPLAIVEHVAESTTGLSAPVATVLADYQTSTYRSRLTSLVREYAGVTAFGRTARGAAQVAADQAARVRDGVADIINAVIEDLVRQRFELPAFGTLVKIATAARAKANRDSYRQVANILPVEVRQRLNGLLILPPGQTRTAWDRVKTEPKRPTPRHMRDFLDHLEWLRVQGSGTAVFAALPVAKVRSFAAEARTLTANVLSDMAEAKRLTLMAALLQSQTARTLDDLADMFIRQMQRTHARAKEALAAQQLQQSEHTEALIALLRDTVLACRDEGPPERRLAAMEALLLPDADAILERCAAHATTAEHGHLPFLARFVRGQRRMFLRFLAAVPLAATSQDRSLEEAITFVLKHQHARASTLRVGDTEEADGERPVRPHLDLSFVPPSWWPLVTGQKARNPTPPAVDRRFFELCLFTQVMIELKSGDLCIPGSDAYSDYRNQLVPWETCRQEMAAYTEQAGLPATPAAIVAGLRERLATVAETVDAAFPANEHLTIVDGKPVLKRLRARPEAAGAAELERELKARLAPIDLIDALADTEHWLNWARHFGPISGFDAKIDRPRERYLATAFCYGCKLGPSQAARAMKTLDRRQIAFLNQRHITEEALDAAITTVIDAYAGFRLPQHWGSGRSASGDGTQWDLHPQSLMSEYHIRYGGYGGIGYYLISDTYIALYSRFMACGAWEGNAILDIVSDNRSALQPDTLHADTQGQSAPIFGLAYLLGIQLMPRIRNWRDLHFYRPDKDSQYPHIETLFTATVDWGLIETLLPDMLRVAVSVKAGRIRPSTILNRLSTYSRKNKLYFAFRELGRVVRTIFLLTYLSSLELRHLIQAATNKSELFNKYAQWVAFGESGLVTEGVRDEQRKLIKYNHLVANLLIFHTLVSMTRALERLGAEGAAVNEAALAGLSPYQTEHINRFGSYTLDFTRIPAPLPTDGQTLPPKPAPVRGHMPSPSSAPV